MSQSDNDLDDSDVEMNKGIHNKVAHSMAINRNCHFQILKNEESFIKWDNFLKKVDTESVLYTYYVANKRSIFDFDFCETLWLLEACLLLFFN